MHRQLQDFLVITCSNKHIIYYIRIYTCIYIYIYNRAIKQYNGHKGSNWEDPITIYRDITRVSVRVCVCVRLDVTDCACVGVFFANAWLPTFLV